MPPGFHDLNHFDFLRESVSVLLVFQLKYLEPKRGANWIFRPRGICRKDGTRERCAAAIARHFVGQGTDNQPQTT
jgi:hypothetical protein